MHGRQADLLAARATREAVPLTSEQLANQPELPGSTTAESFAELPSQLVRAWRLCYGREPSQTEFKLVIEHTAAQLRAMQKDPRGIAAGSNIAKQVLVNYCHALLNSSEFVLRRLGASFNGTL